MKNKKTVIFDLDGTIINSAEDIADALNKAYHEKGIHTNVDISCAHIGPPLHEMILNFTPELNTEQRNQILQSFRAIYDNSPHAKTKLYHGIFEVIRQLHSMQIPLFIATNKPKKPTMSLSLKFGLNTYLKDIVTPDSLDGMAMTKAEMLKFLINRWDIGKSFFITDNPKDMIAAEENDIVSVAVLYGYGSEEELLNAKAHFYIKQPNDILSIIQT
jgi:phosphoglycolate phosphatase